MSGTGCRSFFFFSSRRRHTRFDCDWSSDVCSSDLGAGQFGEVYLRIEALGRGAGFEFVDDVVGGAIPGQYIPAVEKGVRQVLAEGALAGFPIQDVRVTVYDGKHHSVDSKEVAFVSEIGRAHV